LRDACLLVTLTHEGADCRRIEVFELGEERASDLPVGSVSGPTGQADDAPDDAQANAVSEVTP
jgi:hypothetical protein